MISYCMFSIQSIFWDRPWFSYSSLMLWIIHIWNIFFFFSSYGTQLSKCQSYFMSHFVQAAPSKYEKRFLLRIYCIDMNWLYPNMYGPYFMSIFPQIWDEHFFIMYKNGWLRLFTNFSEIKNPMGFGTH